MYLHYNRGDISGQVYAPYIVMLDLSHNPFTHVSALHPMLSDQLSDSCTKVLQSTIDLKIVIIIRFCMANEVNGGYFNQYYNMNIFSYISYISSLKDFLRQATIVFERPDPMLSNNEMTAKKTILDITARRSCRGLVEALHLVESFISQESMPERTEIANKVSELLPGHIRCVDI